MVMRGISDLDSTTRQLLLARAVRSVGQGALVVDLALYLRALQWSGASIGLVLSAAGLLGAGLSLMVGVISDRSRRKPFLLGYEGIVLLASVGTLLSTQPIILGAAIVIGGFGRGANGAAGPFSPAEQAWLAEKLLPKRRGRVYSLNAALGFFGMGLGALIAILPSFWGGWLAGAAAYRPLFAVTGLAAIVNLLLLAQARETHSGPVLDSSPQGLQREAQIRKEENRVLAKVLAINSLNGLAVGLTGPLIAYWFALRFDVGPAEIAPVMAATFLLSGVSSLVTGRLSERIGLVQSVVRARLIGLVLLVLLPIMPTYWAASMAYLLRSVFNRGSSGARQALTIGLVRDERRGLAISLNAVSRQVPRSIGPTLAGLLMDAGLFGVPFYAAAVLQGFYLLAYRRVFRKYEPPTE